MTNSALVRGEVKFGGPIFWTGFSSSLALVNLYIRSTCVIYRRASHAGPSAPLCFARIKLIKLPICYCNMIVLDMHTTAYIAIITLSVRKYITNVK